MKIRNGFVSNSSSSSFALNFKQLNHVPESLHDLAVHLNLVGSPIGTLETIHNKLQNYIKRNNNNQSIAYITEKCDEILHSQAYTHISDYFVENNIDIEELKHKTLYQIVKENDKNIPINEEITEVIIDFSGDGSFTTIQDEFICTNGEKIFGKYLTEKIQE